VRCNDAREPAQPEGATALRGSEPVDGTTTISVVVPSYGRPEVLRGCLEGLKSQDRLPEEVIAVHRVGDTSTERAIRAARHPMIRAVEVGRPGLLAAVEAGALHSSGSVIAFTDDDAVPRPDWLRRIADHFRRPEVGGVGGRDAQPGVPAHASATVVGMVGAWGRLVGNHHAGHGPARDVMILKGVNTAWRRDALSFPRGLRGYATQAHTEIPQGLWALAQGWRVVYDPAIVVDHYPAPRLGESRRLTPEGAYNLVVGMSVAGAGLVCRRLAFGLLVGDRGAPGVLRGAVAVVRGEGEVVRDLRPSLEGQLLAALDLARGRRVTMVPLSAPRAPSGRGSG
jgi:glycosyltransferase involved in cell wall biosynthesis